MKDVMMHQMHMMEQMKSFFDQEIGLFNKNYDSLAKKLDDTQNDIKNLSQKVESIENEVKVIRKDVDKLIEENQDSKINIENLSQKVEKIENEVKKIPLVIDHNWKISTASMGSFNGIIRQLTNECGGNAFEKKMVDITASSPANWGNLKNLVDLDSTEWFGTKDNENSWIKYDFKDKKVCPICYLIRSIAWNDNDHHPKSWVVEGSNSDSDNDWIVLDIKNDCSFLNGRSVVHCFPIQESKEFFRYLRIRQTDKNVSNNYCLAISTLEYFGSIKYT